MKIAININQREWRSIVNHLFKNGWCVKEKYIGSDASIDLDYLILTKEGKSIELAWEILDKGEIKCDKETLEYLESLVKHKFEYGIPKVLNFKMKIWIRLYSFPTRFFWKKEKLMNDFFF